MMYKMKRFMMLVGVAAAMNANAQQPALQNGIKMYNYRKLHSAQTQLTPLAATDAVANYYLGLTYLGMGDLANAEATFGKYPQDPANISGTARVAFAKKDAAKGMTITRDLAKLAKKKEWIQIKYAADAVTYSEGGDYNQAIAWYTDALTKTEDADLHIGLADAYRKVSGGGGKAMDNYEHVTEKDNKNSLAYSRIGDLWYEARNYTSAVDNYNKAKDADSTNPLPFKALADAYSRSAKYQMALSNMKRYMTLSDNTMEDQVLYVELLYNAKSYCDAAKLSQELLPKQTTQDKKLELTGILGFSQAECGDSVSALGNIRSYFSMQDPKKITPGAYIQLGKLYIKLGQLDSAGEYYKKGIAGDTTQNKTDVYRQIADAYKAKKDYAKSAEWYDNLIKANPETQAFDYVWRGIMYYYGKELDKAAGAFSDFATKYPDQPSALYWQGRVASAIDSEASTGLAVPYYTKWLEKVGENYEKKNDLKSAYQYMLYYNYNKKDKEAMKVYMEKIRAIDPKDRALTDIEAAEKAGTAPKKASPPKAK